MTKAQYIQLLVALLMVGQGSGFLSKTLKQLSTCTFIPRGKNGRHGLNAAPAAPATTPDLQTQLTSEGLALCHGILHASGVRSLSDIKSLTETQMSNMGVDSCDRRTLRRVIHGLDDAPDTPPTQLSTVVNGAFETLKEETEEQDFDIQVVCAENDIYIGRLFTDEQCMQMNRMAEYHAYSGIGTVGAGWTNELYTLTDQHMQCKDIPGFLLATDAVFRQLQQKLYGLFPGRIRKGSIVLESDREPHLVKYNGKSKGTVMHTDNSKFISITLNVMLSASDDFSGGGTYIKAIDRTIHLKQGEMLIHLGDLEHAGLEINSGVRRLLISFFTCEWENEELNVPKLDDLSDVVTY